MSYDEMKPRYEAMEKRLKQNKTFMEELSKVASIVAALSYDRTAEGVEADVLWWIAELLGDDEFENEPDPYEGWYDADTGFHSGPDPNDWYDRFREQEYELSLYGEVKS